MKLALYWKTLNEEKKIVQCTLCPHLCALDDGKVGKCDVRKNDSGKLFSLVYGKPAAMNIDPIEKKPLFHFLPGSSAFSLGTYGCNFDCANCQNSDIARGTPDDSMDYVSPKKIVGLAIESGCESIAYTYTEPTIFYEYVLDIAKLAKKNGLKNVLVTNGFINPEPLRKLLPFIDAANVDLKGNSKHYATVCAGSLQPVFDTIKAMHAAGIHIEITNLIIPTLNDSDSDINEVADFVASISKDIPLHFSAFFPMYRLIDLPSTPLTTLLKAKEIAAKKGLNFIYIGNTGSHEDTVCPKCGMMLIRREGFSVKENKLRDGKCPDCEEKINGVWKIETKII